MKELSIEEKAKRYDEALEKSKRLYEQGTITESLCYVFPELKESEDERIRKALIEYFNEQCDMSDWNGVYGYQVVSWLEKQGEQKPWSKEDEKCYIFILSSLEEKYSNKGDVYNWFKSLKQRIGG